VESYNDETQEYDLSKLLFKEFDFLNLSDASFHHDSSIEITSFDYSIKDGSLVEKLIFLCGFGKPTFHIKFSCKTLIVTH